MKLVIKVANPATVFIMAAFYLIFNKLLLKKLMKAFECRNKVAGLKTNQTNAAQLPYSFPLISELYVLPGY